MRRIHFTIINSVIVMKKKFLFGFVMCMIMVFAKPIAGQDHGFGIGIILGEPTGISAKLWTSKNNAFDFGLGFAIGGDRISNHDNYYYGTSRVHFHVDYLWHSFNVIRSTERFPIYYGFGARFNSGGGYDGSFGIRGIIGIAWFPHSTPIDIFVELVPVFQLTPSAGLGFDAGLGIRYFFD